MPHPFNFDMSTVEPIISATSYGSAVDAYINAT